MADSQPMTALVLSCTPSPSSAESSTDQPGQQMLDELAKHDVTGEQVRVVDHDVRPGVELDMGEGASGQPSARRS